ncbi:TspO and MBR like protein [Leptolyngbya sp. BL0902]|uniref:TspO/MBR family protein n=1 Tax=Leptolyngbya sp. BL0902 TaxID=1115757 RepID=UPI0018E850B4|nr:tryptophan-rich sensory protein [Leptolyngbya sp. BL0902]QQE64700.1 TspO and MBR like protein [Leptolyngbya sp. BL0902]
MNRKNWIQQSVNTVMGVRETATDPKIATDLASPRWDIAATLTYLGATLTQVAVMTGLLWGMDRILDWPLGDALPDWAMTAIPWAFFAFITLRSRLFSWLDNTRNSGRYRSLQRPGWAPPPLAFPIVWMSIAVLRITSAYWVWSALGQTFLCWPLVIYMIHLSLGDTWNTIFTVEGRLGAAVPVVLAGPLLSVVVLTASYFQVLPLAGWVIFPSLVWLVVATALCISLWRLNGQEPLYPVVAANP